MRKAKVAAALMCLFCSGMLGGVRFNGNELSVAKADQSNQILEVTDVAVTTTTSIETTTLVITTATTSKKAKSVTTTAATTTNKTTTAATTTSTSGTKKTETTSTTATTEQQTTAESVQTIPETVPADTEAPITTCTEAVATVPETELPQTEAVLQLQQSGNSYAVSVTDREYIMLCNVVGHEYGSDWVPIEEKALVAEVIMNRVNSPQFPNTIYEVLTQYNQFAGLEYLVEMDHMSNFVTQSVRDAVDYYLANPDQYQHGYLYFNGDGYRNYFRSSL